MKFKRILAVLLSALMLSSMASFTVSAQETVPVDLRTTPATDKELFMGNVDYLAAEKENQITWQGVDNVTKLDPIRVGDAANVETVKGDTTYFPADRNFVVEGYGHVPVNNSTGKEQNFVDFSIYRYVLVKYYYAHQLPDGTNPTGANMVYSIKNSELEKNGYVNAGEIKSDALVYNQWDWAVFDTQTASDYSADKKLGAFQYHLFPMGKVASKNTQDTEVMYLAAVQYSADLKADVTYVNNGAALKEGASVPAAASVDFFTNGYALDATVLEAAEAGWTFKGWSLTENGDVITSVDVDASDITLYAVWEYTEPEGDYAEIYLQNVYHKLTMDKSLTIGYLGGSVTVGSGAENAGPNSTVAWRARTTQWFKDNFTDATITEVYAGIGGTGSTFGSYRMTRDLDLANNTIDLLFVDSCVNDSYEGFGYADKDYLHANDEVIVAKILENNPKCEIVFVNVPNNGTIKSAEDSGAVKAHREFAEANGFAFVDFKLGMARELTGDPEATHTEDISKWSTYTQTPCIRPQRATEFTLNSSRTSFSMTL